MNRTVRLLIFGLAAEDSVADVQRLLGPCGQPRLEFCNVQGDEGQRFALVHLAMAATQATLLATRINGCRLHGHRLQGWVPAMPWA